MPSLPQLPEATAATPTDKMMLDQNGISRATTVATLHAGLQPKLTLAQGALLGRVSPSPGQPEPINIGPGLKLTQGVIATDPDIIAPISSPHFAGTPTAPTPAQGDSSTALATTAFVQARTLQPLTLTGDIVGSTAPSTSGTLPTTLPAITVPGNFAKVTVNAKGQVTAGAATLAATDVTGLSDALIQSSGSSVARSLADRAHDSINVRDHGALLDGVTDDTPAFARAQQAAQNRGGALIVVPPGTAYLGSTVYTISANGWLIHPGVSFTGPGQILGLTDQVSANIGLTLAKFSAEGQGASTLFVSNFVGASNSTVSYEKNAIYARIVTGDPSAGAIQRDAVAGEFQAHTLPGTSAARIWAINPIATIAPYSDAYALGAEIAVENNGQSQPLVDQPNSKIGVNIIAGGPQLSSAGLLINGGPGTDSSGNAIQSQWATGIFIKDIAVSDKALRVATATNAGWADVASIDRAGNAQLNTLAITGNGAQSSFASVWTSNNPGNGAFQWNFTGSVPSASVIGPLTTIYNNGPHCAQAEKFQYFSQAGAADSVDNAQTLIGIYNPQSVSGANMGAELVRWTVGITPQDTTHNWTHVVEEYNVVNRGLDMGWKAYRNDPVNNITGPQQITGIVNYSPEATGLGQPGEGKNLLFAELFGQSAANNASGIPSRFYNASLYEPNCVVGGSGRAIYINGDLTGVSAQIPYAPLEISLTWLHGLRTTTAVFQDGQAMTMATAQSIAWSNGSSTAKIQATGTGANQDIILSPTGTGAVRLAILSASDSTGLNLGTSNSTVLQVKDNGVAALSKLVVTPGNGGAPAILAISGETNQGLIIRSAGAGQINFQSGSGGSTNALTIMANSTAVNALSVTGGSTGQNVVLGVNGSDSNVSIQINPQGTGTVYINKLQAAGGTVDGTPIGASTPSTGAFTTLKTTGLASFTAALADASFSSQTPTNGFAITIANGVSTLQLTPAAALANGTITLPAAPGNGQWLFVTSTSTISNCTFTPASGQTILGAPTALPAYVEVALQYQSSSSRWVCQAGNDSRIANAASSTNLLFGTGADGAVTLSSGTTTLTRDMHYTSLSLSGTGAIAANGFRIYVNTTLDISAAQSGAIFVTTYAGNNASAATAGAASTTNSFGANAAGLPIPFQAGAAGGNGTSTIGAAGAAISTVNSWGGDASAAGAGGAGNNGAQAAGAAGTAGSGVLQTGFFFGAAIPSYPTTGSGSRITAGISGSGGGGGGGDAANAGGGGGGGGYGGGTLLINARTISRGSNTNPSIFQAKGANGGNGANATGGNAGGGGGGSGGGGGFIGIVTETLVGSTITNAIDTSGGNGGTGGNGLGTGKGGTGGGGGGSGYQHLLVLSSPTIPTTTKTAGSLAGTATTTAGTTGGAGAIVRGAL